MVTAQTSRYSSGARSSSVGSSNDAQRPDKPGPHSGLTGRIAFLAIRSMEAAPRLASGRRAAPIRSIRLPLLALRPQIGRAGVGGVIGADRARVHIRHSPYPIAAGPILQVRLGVHRADARQSGTRQPSRIQIPPGILGARRAEQAPGILPAEPALAANLSVLLAPDRSHIPGRTDRLLAHNRNSF